MNFTTIPPCMPYHSAVPYAFSFGSILFQQPVHQVTMINSVYANPNIPTVCLEAHQKPIQQAEPIPSSYH